MRLVEFGEALAPGTGLTLLFRRLDAILTGFVHTSDARYDAWASYDAGGTAVLLSDRDILGFVEIQNLMRRLPPTV